MLDPRLIAKALNYLMWAAAAAAVVAGIWAAGSYSGHQAERLLQQKQINVQLLQAEQRRQTEVKRGDQAAQTLREQLAELQTSNDQLTRSLANVPRLVSTPACAQPGASRLTRAGLVRLNAALGHRDLPGASGDVGSAAGTDPAATEQWSEPTSVTVDDAQSNAEINYGRCAAIRTRCLALIDFIKARPDQGNAQESLNER